MAGETQTQNNQNPYASYGGSLADQSAGGADPYAAYGGQILPQRTSDVVDVGGQSVNLKTGEGASQAASSQAAKELPWPKVMLADGSVHEVHPEDVRKAVQQNPGAKVDSGVYAGLKRVPGAIAGIYHAFTEPATEQEKSALLAKVREQNGKGDNIPEDLATNPNRPTLAWHRLIDAPADELETRGRNEQTAARDLLSHGKTMEGASRYLNSLADYGLSAVPLAGPAIESIANRYESGDKSGAATDIATAWALENARPIARAGGKAVGAVSAKTAETVGAIPGKIKNVAQDITPESLTARKATPSPQHGTPLTVESPLDGPTVGKQLGGKDLSTEALEMLKQHAGDKIPVGSTAKNTLMKAVEPVSKAIADTSSKMNDVVQNAPQFATSVMQDNVFGEGSFTKEIENLKKNLPDSVRGSLSKDVDGVLEDADKALNSNDPAEVLEQRRLLGRRIDWDKIEKNPSTPAEVQNLTRAKVYKALGDKLHSEVPETVSLDKILQPNLELRSHMASKLGQRVIDDALSATAEAQSEFKKGKTMIDNAAHNEAVTQRWKKIAAVAKVLGYSGVGAEILKHLVP